MRDIIAIHFLIFIAELHHRNSLFYVTYLALKLICFIFDFNRILSTRCNDLNKIHHSQQTLSTFNFISTISFQLLNFFLVIFDKNTTNMLHVRMYASQLIINFSKNFKKKENINKCQALTWYRRQVDYGCDDGTQTDEYSKPEEHC